MAQKFPNIGLRAVLEISGFQKNYQRYQKSLRDMDKATQRAAQSMSRSGQAMGNALAGSADSLLQSSQVLKDLAAFGALGTNQLEELRQAFSSLGAGVGVNIEKFEDLISSGTSMEDSVLQSAQAMDTAAGAAGGLGAQLFISAAAIGAVTIALRASIGLVQRSISEYNDLAEATRRLRYQTGLMSEEASGWVLAMQAGGLSTAGAERAMTSFLGKVSQLSREQALGEESTGRFAEAMETLQISIKDGEGNLKTTADLLRDVEEAFRDLGPGAQSAGAATALFGFSGRGLLPILLSTNLSLSELMQTSKDYGATLNSLSQKEYERFVEAHFQLLSAVQGVFNFIAKKWTPILAEVQSIVASSISIWRSFWQILTGNAEPILSSLAGWLRIIAEGLEGLNILMQRAARVSMILHDAVNPLGALFRRMAQDTEALAAARARAAKAAADQEAADKKAREELEKTIEKLDDLKTRFRQKLDDIDRDAEQKWEDILVTRQRQAMDRALQLAWRLDDLRAAYNQRLDAIEQDFADRWDDILVKRQREALERGIRLAQRYEDLARSTEQRRADTLRDFADREVEQRRDTQKRIEDVERDARRKREELERDHQRRLEAIQLKFLDTAQEAARRNDAVAVARAQRERNRELRDERRRFEDEQYDLADSLRKKREDIQRDRQEREADQRRELARALQRIEENAQRQRDAIARQTRRESEARARKEAQELEDFNKAKDEQIEAAEEWYDKQIEELEKAQRREEILRRIQQERQYADFRRNWNRRISEARLWYELERNDLATHLNYTARQLEQAYANWIQQAVVAANAAAVAIAAAWSRAINLRGSAGNLGIIGGRGISMAEGGVIQASSPTHVIMGDAGPETGIFLPGHSGGMNVNHNFGRLGVDFNGLPGGMNTQQVQAIVYQTMIGLAKSMQVPRT